MSRIAKSDEVMLEVPVGGEKPSLVYTDSWELSLGSGIHQVVYGSSLGDSWLEECTTEPGNKLTVKQCGQRPTARVHFMVLYYWQWMHT